MRSVLKAFMPDCKKATYLIEKSNDTALPLKDKMQLNMHLSLCNGCRNYAKQSRFLECLLKRYAHVLLVKKPETAKLEQRIILKMKEMAPSL